MVHIVCGEKGKGKTKVILEKANEAVKTSGGNVVFLDKDLAHMYELNNLTIPDVSSMTADSKRLLKSAGFSEVLASGSLANVGLVLSGGDELSDPADIERRARGIGLYTKETIVFPGSGEDSKDNQFIVLTDAAGNRIIMPYSGIRERILIDAFGYEEAGEQEK